MAGLEGVEAGSFVDLHLEELEPLDVLVRRGHELQSPTLVGQEQSDVGGSHEFGGAVGDHQQELDDVVVVDERVGELHENVGEPFTGYNGHAHLQVLAVPGSAVGNRHVGSSSSRRVRVTTSRATSSR